MKRALIVGGPDDAALARVWPSLELWHGQLDRAYVLREADLVVVLPGGNGEAEARRARGAGAQVVEVV